MDVLLAFVALIVGFAGAIVLFVTGTVEGFKRVFPKVPSRFYPVVAVAAGILWALVIGLQIGMSWQLCSTAGFVAGLSSAGLYALGKNREEASRARVNERLDNFVPRG